MATTLQCQCTQVLWTRTCPRISSRHRCVQSYCRAVVLFSCWSWCKCSRRSVLPTTKPILAVLMRNREPCVWFIKPTQHESQHVTNAYMYVNFQATKYKQRQPSTLCKRTHITSLEFGIFLDRCQMQTFYLTWASHTLISTPVLTLCCHGYAGCSHAAIPAAPG